MLAEADGVSKRVHDDKVREPSAVGRERYADLLARLGE